VTCEGEGVLLLSKSAG